MTVLLLAALLSGSPAPAVLVQLDRVARSAERCLDLEGAVRRLGVAELELATAVTRAERRRALAAWFAARAELRAALRGSTR